MLRMLRRIQRIRKLLADLLHELVVIFLIKLRRSYFKFLLAVFRGQISQSGADFLDLLMRKLNGVEHLLF